MAKRREKLSRKIRANSGALVPERGCKYIICPNTAYLGLVPVEVCRMKYLHWDKPIMGLSKGTEFAKKFCSECTYWRRYTSEDRWYPTEKNERTIFLAPLRKLERVLHEVGSQPKLKRVRSEGTSRLKHTRVRKGGE